MQERKQKEKKRGRRGRVEKNQERRRNLEVYKQEEGEKGRDRK